MGAEVGLVERVVKLESGQEAHNEDIARLETLYMKLDTDIKDLKNELRGEFSHVHKGLNEVVVGALNSAPEWAVRQMASTDRHIGTAWGVAGTLLAAVLLLLGWVLFHHV